MEIPVLGKSFVRLKEDGRSVVFLTESVDEQEFLTRAKPAVFHITGHYRGYPAVLARLAALSASEARLRLERAWRVKAPSALVKRLDESASLPRRPRRLTDSRGARGRAEEPVDEGGRSRAPRRLGVGA